MTVLYFRIRNVEDHHGIWRIVEVGDHLSGNRNSRCSPRIGWSCGIFDRNSKDPVHSIHYTVYIIANHKLSLV